MRSEGSKYFDDYVFALNWAQTYAKIDRELMMVRVLDAVRARDGDLGIVPGSMRAQASLVDIVHTLKQVVCVKG